MTMPGGEMLIGPDDPDPAAVFNAGGVSPFLIVGDHAGNAIPARLGTLGLSERDRDRHIAWDIGVSRLGTLLAEALDATFISQRFSRLVIDCNRAPASADAIAAVSDQTSIPGNADLAPDQRDLRIAAIHKPYHDRIRDELDRRETCAHETILLALHSFTPMLQTEMRPWHAGVLYWRGETGFARALLGALDIDGINVADNEPYRMDDTDYTVPFHCFPRGLGYAEIEIRQDLLIDAQDIVVWATRLATAAQAAREHLLRSLPNQSG